MKRLLPVGSVLKLNVESNKKWMIFARLVKEKEQDQFMWDYCACLVPQGFQEQEKLRFFNHDEIQQLLFIGYQDEEELQYSAALADIKNDMDKK